MKNSLFLILIVFVSSCQTTKTEETSVIALLSRSIGNENTNGFEFQLKLNTSTPDWFTLQNKNGKILVTGNSPIALTREFKFKIKK
jgi:hypothetical protein